MARPVFNPNRSVWETSLSASYHAPTPQEQAWLNRQYKRYAVLMIEEGGELHRPDPITEAEVWRRLDAETAWRRAPVRGGPR